MEEKPELSWTKLLLLDEGIRALVCMLPVEGTFILMISLMLTSNIMILAILTLIYAFINGLTKATKLGQTVTMYTATTGGDVQT